jgi:hypothetical protein
MHARQQIRDAAVAALNGNITATVVPERIWILQTDELPLVGVYTQSEANSLDEQGAAMGQPTTIYRELELTCDIAVTGATGALSASHLDDLAEEIERELGASRKLAGAMDTVPASWEVEQSQESEQIVSRATLVFTVMYRTAIGAADTLI